MSFRLYESEGCHLCEQAKQLLLQSQMTNDSCELIEIALSESLIERFGESIPVLEHVYTSELLFWPFNLEQLNHWIEQKINL